MTLKSVPQSPWSELRTGIMMMDWSSDLSSDLNILSPQLPSNQWLPLIIRRSLIEGGAVFAYGWCWRWQWCVCQCVSPDIVCGKKTASHLEKRSLYGRPTVVCSGTVVWNVCALILNYQVFRSEVKGIICCEVIVRGVFSYQSNGGKAVIYHIVKLRREVPM